MKRFSWIISLTAVCALVAACGSSSKSSSTSASAASNNGKVGGKLVIDNESGSTWTCTFNPFNPSVSITSDGFVYEPLEPVNILQNGKTTPWLATGNQWSNGYKTLTFTIRNGVKWSDGKPFSANDVVYTFNAMKGDAKLDLNALWKADGGPLTNVALKGSNQVVMTFDAPAQEYFFFVSDFTPIVPQHIWSTLNQSKLDSYTDKQPIGTGPYLVSNCAPQNIKYLRNPNYWQSTSGHPVPQINEVDYPAFLSNTPANLLLSQGGAQWGGQYVPNVNSFYVAKDPAHRHIWYAPILNVGLVPNLDNPLLGALPVRQALTYAIDRATVARLGEGGQQQPANQTGVLTPTYQSWYDSSLPQPNYDPSKAQQILTSAGYKKGSDGIFRSPSGQPLTFTIKTISGFTDWDASLAIITQELKAVGISTTFQDETTSTYTTDLQSGHYQLAYAGSGSGAQLAGPTPYYELRGYLFSGNIGSTNYSRYKSPSTDTLFNQYAGANQSQQVQIIHQIEKVMVNDIPFIPVTEGVDWYQYDTTHIAGWPTQSNPYAQPSPYATPDNGVVLTHLYPTG
jgi:peptide/nickel transport system substrate-binding protein